MVTRRKLTISQRQALLKWGCLLLSAVMVVSVFCAIPVIAGAIPMFSASSARSLLADNEALGGETPAFALGNGNFEFLSAETTQGEFEPETPIPIPEPGEYDLPVLSSNICWYNAGDEPSLNIINRTSFDVNLNDYLKKTFPISGVLPSDEPLVLIVHTHGSESYLDNGYDYYSPEETFRSLDESKTVVGIGDMLCEKLNSLGIKTVHDRTMYDTTEFNKAYNYSREGIKKALADYPSIRFVIDLHRDSIFDANDRNVKPLTTINGKDCAQLMIVVGTNEGGSNHPNWRNNLTFATHLQQRLNDMYPTLARPINLRSSAFNQALATGSILLEVGACGNTVEEAENAISLFAESYASLIKQHLKP